MVTKGVESNPGQNGHTEANDVSRPKHWHGGPKLIIAEPIVWRGGHQKCFKEMSIQLLGQGLLVRLISKN